MGTSRFTTILSKICFSRVLYAILVIGIYGCTAPDQRPKSAPEKQPNLVIIGEDLSGTFDQFPATTEQELKDLCKAIMKSNAGGKIYFIGIGNSTPKGYAYCEIRPTLAIDSSQSVGVIRNIKSKNAQIAKINQRAAEAFIEKAAAIFEERKQDYTDINGFFEKVSSIVETPTYINYRKWLYVNSDGKQDSKTSNKVDCSLLPSVDEYFVSRGWKSKANCNPIAKLPDTAHFVEYFEEQTTAANLK